MHKHTVTGGALMLGSGEIALLTAAQLASRRHNVEVLEETKSSAKVRIINPLSFKEGEVLELERLPKSANAPAADAFAPQPEHKTKKPTRDALAKAHEEGKAEGLAALETKVAEARRIGRGEMLAEVMTRNGLLDALDAAQEAFDAADEADKEAAKAKLDDAQKAVDDLGELVA